MVSTIITPLFVFWLLRALIFVGICLLALFIAPLVYLFTS